MALNDCTVTTTVETIDPTLTVAGVVISAGAISQGGTILPAIGAVWTPPTNPWVTGVKFEYQEISLANGSTTTTPQTPSQGTWSTTSNVITGKTYRTRWRAMGLNAAGPWSTWGNITIATNLTLGSSSSVAWGAVNGLGRPDDFADVTSDRRALGLVQAGTIISGGVPVPAGAQPLSMAVTDAQVVTLSPTYAVAPLVQFIPIGLAPLGAGETYSLQARSLSGSGFTASLQKITPGTPTFSTRTDGPTTVQTAPDDWRMEKGVTADAYNYLYTFRVKGNIRVTMITVPPDGEVLIGGGMVLEFWTRSTFGGAWVSRGSFNVNPTGSEPSAGTYTYDRSVTLEIAAAIGQHADTEWKVTVKSRNDPIDVITEFTSVVYQYQSAGGAPTTATATPNGETVLCLVTPRNS